jgi:hypothetical protein
MLRTALGAAVVVVAAAAVAATSLHVAQTADAAKPKHGGVAQTPIELLYVLDAKSGTLRKRAGKDQYLLTLNGTADHLSAFSDRPHRLSFVQSRRSYLATWQRSYKGDPPNAALQLVAKTRSGRHIADTVIVELRAPRVHGDTVTFLAHRLRTAGGGLKDHGDRLLASPPSRFGSASLFIDDASWYQFLVVLDATGDSGTGSNVCTGDTASDDTGSCLAVPGPVGLYPFQTFSNATFSWTGGGIIVTLGNVDLCRDSWAATDNSYTWASAAFTVNSGTVVTNLSGSPGKTSTYSVAGGTDGSLITEPGGPLYADLEYKGSQSGDPPNGDTEEYTLELSGYLQYTPAPNTSGCVYG